MKRSRAVSALAALCLCFSFGPHTSAATLDIPQGHPRLWYSTQAGSPGLARLQRARAFSASQPVPITGYDRPQQERDRALRSVIRGQTSPFNATNDPDCASAAGWLKTFVLTDTDTASSDEARYYGENAILVYDWCNYALSDAERAALITRWNGYTTKLNAKDWGGLAMASNNYFWGYVRNGLLWGMASYHDGGAAQRQTAQGFIDHALDKRYRNLANPQAANSSKFFGWYEAFGVGGVTLEGLQYGRYLLDYPVIGFTSATDYGYDAWNAVPYWRDAVYYLEYAGTPAATRAQDGGVLRYELFPFNDDQYFKNGQGKDGYRGSVEGHENFLGAMILRDPSKPLARQAKQWLDKRDLAPDWWVRAELSTAAVTASGPTLPLDYYAAGSQYFYGRSANTSTATTFMQELGGPNAYKSTARELEPEGGAGHSHEGLGNFQLWRKGRWITRETTGYSIESDGIRGWNGSTDGPLVDPLQAVAHNTVLFQGRGQIYSRHGWPKVLRLQSTPDFAYSAVDMIKSYRGPANKTWLAKDDWPFAEVAIREFVYLRALETLVVLDRLKSGSDSLNTTVYDGSYTGPRLSGSQVKKTFVLHATATGNNENGNPFALGAGKAIATVGDQRMDLQTLLPANPAYRVIDEGGDIGQFRLEYDSSGSEASTLLNVVSARDAGEAQVTAALSDLGDVWQVTLSHPQKGSATLILRKGETSAGGSVRIGQAEATALRESVQGMLITDNGPLWEGSAQGRVTGGNLPPRLAVAPAASVRFAGTAAPSTPARLPERGRRAAGRAGSSGVKDPAPAAAKKPFAWSLRVIQSYTQRACRRRTSLSSALWTRLFHCPAEAQDATIRSVR
jgi:hypothetical protein